MELFALNEEVYALEARLAQLEGQARLQTLISLAWHLRQRDSTRSMQLADESETWLSSSRFDDIERSRTLARLLLIRGESAWLAANLDAAENSADAADMLFKGVDDPIGMGDAKWLLASVWQDRGDLLRSNDCLESAVADYRAGGDQVRVEITRAHALQLAAFQDAHATVARLMSLFDPAVQYHPSVMAWLASARAVAEGVIGDMNASVKYFLQAYLAAQESGQIMHAILSATNGADSFANLGDLEAALEWDERALALARGGGHPGMMANPLMQTGNVLRLLGRHSEAKTILCEALALMAELKHSTRYAIALDYMGELSLDLGDPGLALDYFCQAGALAKALKDSVLVLSCLRGQASAFCHLARPQEALTTLAVAFAAAKELGNEGEEIRMLRVYAELYHHYSLPPPEKLSAPSARLHYLNQALAIAAGITGYTLSAELLDEVASAYAAMGDHRLAYDNALASTEARDNTRLDAARNRAVAMHVREATERANADAEHHRQLADMEAKRVAALQESIATLETLGLIGRRITANLDLDNTLESIYGAINQVIDAPSLMIAVVDETQASLDYRLVITQGERQEPFHILLAEESFGCWCVNHRSDILIGDIDAEYSRYLTFAPRMIYGNTEKSLVFVPLIAGDQILGMLTVQSPQRQAYDKCAVETVRAIGAYVAIAIENARLFRRILDSEQSLRQEHTALLNAQAELKKLHGIIPICSACKKIRDDGGAWHQLESYIRDHSEAEFTHGICPECVERLYGDLLKRKGSQSNG